MNLNIMCSRLSFAYFWVQYEDIVAFGEQRCFVAYQKFERANKTFTRQR